MPADVLLLKSVQATRYVTPLREGGSLPAVVEADDDGLYVLKFRGAGQGPKALVAELVAGELARALALPMPEIALVELDREFARTEPDPEIQDLIRAAMGSTWGSTTCPVRSTTIRRRCRSMPSWPRASSGSTPSSAMWTAPRATRT